MDHKDAVERYAAEQYLLGELNQSEMEEFEAHMFECPVCAEQVKLGIALFDEARRTLKEARQVDAVVASARRPFCRTFPKRSKPRDCEGNE